MSKKVIIALSLICLIAFGLRIMSGQSVFGMGFVNYIETDAWYKMGLAQQISAMPFWSGYQYMTLNNQLFSWIISIIPGNIEVVGAWLPPVIATLAIIVVFFIGRELFNNAVGLLSALFVSIIPSEFLQRSLLGFTDHHVMEVFLMCLMILFTIKAVKANKIIWYILAGVSLFLYMLNWQSGIYLAGLILVVFVDVIFIVNLISHERWDRGIVPIILIGLIGLALYLPIGGYRQLLFFTGSQSVPAQTTGEIISTVTSSVSGRTTSELMPLLAPYGSFSFRVIITNLHLFVIAFILGLVYLRTSWKQRTVLILISWTLILLAISLNERRFLYYLTIPIGIISAYGIYEFSHKVKGNTVFNAVFFSLPLVFISLFFAITIGRNQPMAMTQDWHNALTWLKTQPENGMVTAWTDYGHWIKYVSGKSPNYLPGPGGDLVAKYYLSYDPDDSEKYLQSLDTGYLIIDELSIKRHYDVLSLVSGMKPVKSETLAYQIYYKNKIPDYLNLVYECQGIKVFRYQGSVSNE